MSWTAVAAAALSVAASVLRLLGASRKAEAAEARLDAMRRKKKVKDDVASQSDTERRRTADRFVRKRNDNGGR